VRRETASLRTARRLSGAILAALLSLPAGLARAQSDKDVETARALFVEASTLADQGRFADARDRYQLSLRLRRAAITLYSLGVVDRELGRLVEAQESFRAFLAEPSAPGTQGYEEPARKALAEIDGKLAAARLADATTAPPAAGATAPLASGPVPAPLAPVARLDRTIPFALIGGGGALFVVGLVTGLVGLAQAGNAGSPTDAVAESARTKGFIGDFMAGAGLAAAGAGVVVLLVQKSPEPAKAASVRPWIAGTRAGVTIQF
jgi:tetratricopeptide (TPR) repeat protein